MEIQKLTAFFLWCTIINVAVLIFSVIMFILVPDFVYNTQNKLFPLPRESFDVILYAFLGLYKVFILVFNLVPYVALRIVGKRE